MKAMFRALDSMVVAAHDAVLSADAPVGPQARLELALFNRAINGVKAARSLLGNQH